MAVHVDFSKVNYINVQSEQRLDNFLLKILKGVPKSHIYKLIQQEIRVNKKRAKAHARLMVGDVVRLPPVRVASVRAPIVGEKVVALLQSRVLFEDDGLLVLNKPFGMAVHGGSGVSAGVIECARTIWGKHLELVHRLDKETSGVLLIAKKRSRLRALQAHFADKSAQKNYLCIVRAMQLPSNLPCQHLDWHNLSKGTHLWQVDAPLLRYTVNGERRVRVDDGGKPSYTDFYLLDKKGSYCLLRAIPKTGRTHQIRVHLAYKGAPILGDDKYQGASASRLMLHAHTLTIDGQSFCAPVPDDFCHAWDLL